MPTSTSSGSRSSRFPSPVSGSESTRGRIPVSDITGAHLQPARLTGTEFHIAFPFGNLEFSACYTGLMNVRRSTGTFMSGDDYDDANTEAVYAFGASRLVGKVTVQFAQLFGGNRPDRRGCRAVRYAPVRQGKLFRGCRHRIRHPVFKPACVEIPVLFPYGNLPNRRC